MIASEKIGEITAKYSMLLSLSVSNMEDSLEQNIHHIQAMQATIAAEMCKLHEDPVQADQTSQVTSLQEKDQQLAEIMEEEMTHWEQVSVLSWMHLW